MLLLLHMLTIKAEVEAGRRLAIMILPTFPLIYSTLLEHTPLEMGQSKQRTIQGSGG